MASNGFHAKTVKECWIIASHEAERYQNIVNRLLQEEAIGSDLSLELEFIKLMAKRNAASRIGRLIRFGTDAVGSNHESGHPTGGLTIERRVTPDRRKK